MMLMLILVVIVLVVLSLGNYIVVGAIGFLFGGFHGAAIAIVGTFVVARVLAPFN